MTTALPLAGTGYEGAVSEEKAPSRTASSAGATAVSKKSRESDGAPTTLPPPVPPPPAPAPLPAAACRRVAAITWLLAGLGLSSSLSSRVWSGVVVCMCRCVSPSVHRLAQRGC